MTRQPEWPNPPTSRTGWPIELTCSVVQVLGVDGRPMGTGFLVSERLIVTCAHLLTDVVLSVSPTAGAVRVRFTHVDGAARTASVDPQLWRDPAGTDVAFLRLVDAPPAQALPLLLGSSAGAGQHRVKIFGFPSEGLREGHYGYGIAGDRVRDDSGAPLLQLTGCTEVTEGFSGGPVLDQHTGLVIGMVNSVTAPDRLGRGQESAFVTVAETLREVCPQLALTEICPYRGLEAFTADDVDWFHGRNRVVAAALASLGRDSRFLALLGPSGSGKSSVIHAGVLPALARGGIPGSERWGWISARLAADPYVQLELAGLSGASNGLAAAAQRWLADHPAQERLVLVLDQLEELLVTPPSSAPHADLLEQLVDLPGQQPVSIIVVLRNDFYGRLAAVAPTLMSLVEHALVNVPGRLEPTELAAMIGQPAAVTGLSLEPNLAERIVGDAVQAAPPPDLPSGGAAVTVLPLLEFALTELWQRRADGCLTHRAYDQIGGVVGGLTRWCDQAYGDLETPQRLVARRVLTALVRPGDDAANVPPTRQRRTLEQLRATVGERQDTSSADVDAVVHQLVHARLLVTSRDPASDEPIVELVHEALIRRWGVLAQWLVQDDDFLVWRNRLEADHARWAATTVRRGAHDPEQMLRGSALDAARHWLDDRPGELPVKLVEFIRLSDRLERRRRNRDRNRVRLLAVLLVLAVGLGSFSAFLTYRAQQRALIATAQSLAAQATDLVSRQTDLAQLLSLESLRTAPTREAWASVQTMLSRPTHSYRQLTGHRDSVRSVSFSPDGRLVATASRDGTARLWEVASGQPVGEPLTGHTAAIWDLSFSPDGRLVATASVDGTARLWEVASGQPVGEPLTGHTAPLHGVAFSPDGRLVATASDDGTARLWEVASGQPVGEPLTGHTDLVHGVAFSPDGGLVATASSDGTARLWEVASGQPVGEPLTGHTGVVFRVAFSPDGALLGTAGWDGTARLWDVDSGQPVGEPLAGHTDAIFGVAFSPDGALLGTASFDRTARLWDVDSGQPVGEPLTGHTRPVNDVVFSPEGTELATVSNDGTARLWEVATRQPVGGVLADHTEPISGVAFSPDDMLLAVARGSVELWDIQGRKPVGDPFTEGINNVAVSPDGELLATAGIDGTARLWEVASRQPVGEPLTGHTGAIIEVAFSPDGALLATAGIDDGTARLWEVASGQPVGEPLAAHDGPVNGVAFSADGTLLATTGIDETARLWEVASGQPVGEPLTAHAGGVFGVAFSPDGALLATTSFDQTMLLWDVVSRQPVVEPLTGHTDLVFDVAFSSNGTLLATASNDGTVRLWARPSTWVAHLCELVGRNLSQAEWDRYIGSDTTYVRHCSQYPSGPNADPGASVAGYPERPDG